MDISTEDDVALLIDTFYKRVVTDPLIAHFFTEVVQLNWHTHIPIMNRFWCSVLLGTGSYSGQPMRAHLELNQKSALTSGHFERWLELWTDTVHSLFEGELANRAINQAKMMAHLIQDKLDRSANKGFIQ